MNGVAMTTSSEVEKFAHTSSGMRKNDMPGARIVMIVTRKFSAVAIDDAPANCTADREEHLADRRRGATAARRPSSRSRTSRRAPGTTAASSMPAIGSSQNDSAFRRGKAMSGAPIISGSTKFASPAKTGMMNRKISSDAWTLKRPL